MPGEGKTLTVSYGAFSCTLEGYDDPLPAMRQVAGYFRDLVAADPGFGAHPPALAAPEPRRIPSDAAPRRITDDRPGDADDPADCDAAATDARDAPAPETIRPADPEDGDSVAARLRRIRAVVARTRDPFPDPAPEAAPRPRASAQGTRPSPSRIDADRAILSTLAEAATAIRTARDAAIRAPDRPRPVPTPQRHPSLSGRAGWMGEAAAGTIRHTLCADAPGREPAENIFVDRPSDAARSDSPDLRSGIAELSKVADATRGTHVRRTGADRPAPLLLVSDQRVDLPRLTDGRGRNGECRNGRGAIAPKDDPAARGFARFVARIRAHDLTERLEAAAAYALLVEGRPKVSAAHLRRLVTGLDRGGVTRAAARRGLAALLRGGGLRRLGRGRMTLARETRFDPRPRLAGE